MNSGTNRFSAISILIPVVAIILTALFSSLAEEGVVIDKTTSKPIPGAVVVATWTGVVGVMVQGSTQCFKAEVRVTDEKGRFEVSSFSWNLNPFMIKRQRDFIVVASGYREAADWNPGDPRVLMEPQAGSKSDQFKRLPRFQPLGCHVPPGVLLPYLKARYAEMKSLAGTKEEKLETSRVLSEIEFIEIGDTEALKRSSLRRAEIEKETH